MVDIRCDVQQLDDSGHVWAFLDEAADTDLIVPGAIVVAGDDEEPAFAQVVDIVGAGPHRRVRRDIAPGAPGLYLRAAARSGLAAPSQAPAHQPAADLAEIAHAAPRMVATLAQRDEARRWARTMWALTGEPWLRQVNASLPPGQEPWVAPDWLTGTGAREDGAEA